MFPSKDHQPPGAGSSDDLNGLDILLVEDSRDVGDALKDLLELWERTWPGQQRP